MEFFNFIFDFFLDPNVYVAGLLVYLFGPWFKRMAVKLWGKIR